MPYGTLAWPSRFPKSAIWHSENAFVLTNPNVWYKWEKALLCLLANRRYPYVSFDTKHEVGSHRNIFHNRPSKVSKRISVTLRYYGVRFWRRWIFRLRNWVLFLKCSFFGSLSVWIQINFRRKKISKIRRNSNRPHQRMLQRVICLPNGYQRYNVFFLFFADTLKLLSSLTWTHITFWLSFMAAVKNAPSRMG